MCFDDRPKGEKSETEKNAFICGFAGGGPAVGTHSVRKQRIVDQQAGVARCGSR